VRTAYFQFDASMSAPWRTSFLDAVNRWNAAGADLRFQIQTPSSGVNFYVGQVATGYTQWINGSPNNCASGFNQSGTAGVVASIGNNGAGGDIQAMHAMIHELGHSGGLSHVGAAMHCGDTVTPGGSVPKSVMRVVPGGTSANAHMWAYENCGQVLAPYADDIAGFNALYPGGK
jgi:hypothetical protein